MNISEIILNHYNTELEARRIKQTDAVEFQVDMSKYKTVQEEVKEMISFHLKNYGFCSDILFHQLTRHRMQIGEIFGEALEYYRASDILYFMDAIELKKIEGDMFRYIPLKGLYKIHHNPISGIGFSLLLNIKNYWFDEQDQMKKKREKNYNAILNKVVDGDISHILNYMHMEAVHSKKMTGEWLIYAKHNNKNYFLCLATHCEHDQNIFDNKILQCYEQFPELKCQ